MSADGTTGRPAGRWEGARQRLLRITSGGRYLPEVDGIRFLAISLVLLQHVHERVSRRAVDVYPQAADPSPAWIFLQGDFGVQLFFALSGFILFRGLATAARSGKGLAREYGRYLLRRVTRLEPPYLLVMVGIFLFLWVTGYQSGYARSSQQGSQSLSQSLGASLAYAHTLLYGTFPKLNPPAWSLETEFQFYLVAPLVVWSSRRASGNPWVRSGWFLLLIVILVLWVLPVASASAHLRHGLAVYLPLFLTGFIAGEIHEALGLDGTPGPSTRRWLDAIGLAAVCVLLRTGYAVSGGSSVPGYCAWMLALLLGCTGGDRLRRVLSWGFLPVVGGMCYSIYLVHLPFLEFAASATRRLGQGLPYAAYLALQCGILLVLTGGVASVFYVLVERPCMERDWPRRLVGWIRGRRSATERGAAGGGAIR